MKFINMIILLGLLSYSWCLFNSPLTVSEEVQMNLQNHLKTIIFNYIDETLVNAKNIRFNKMTTESIDKNNIKALFKYSFEDGSDNAGVTVNQLTGYALLKKNLRISDDNPDAEEYWDFESLRILNNDIEYKDGLKVDAKPDKTE